MPTHRLTSIGLQLHLRATLKEKLIMMEKADDEEAGQPTLMPNLTRLLVSHYLREHPHRVVLIKLYRPFVFLFFYTLVCV